MACMTRVVCKPEHDDGLVRPSLRQPEHNQPRHLPGAGSPRGSAATGRPQPAARAGTRTVIWFSI